MDIDCLAATQQRADSAGWPEPPISSSSGTDRETGWTQGGVEILLSSLPEMDEEEKGWINNLSPPPSQRLLGLADSTLLHCVVLQG